MKTYENVLVLIADGGKDQLGSPNGTLAEWGATKDWKPWEFISVRLDYNIEKPIGRASNFHWEGEKLFATLEIIDDFNASGGLWFPCIAATITTASSPKFNLYCIGLCSTNSDKRIPALP